MVFNKIVKYSGEKLECAECKRVYHINWFCYEKVIGLFKVKNGFEFRCREHFNNKKRKPVR